MEKKISRCTCDLDDRSVKSLIHCLKVFKRYGFVRDLSVNTSPSGKGHHIIAWTDKKGVSRKKLLKIRRKAGDDRIRCWLDSKCTRQMQVLFTTKEKSKTNLKLDNISMENVVQGSEQNTKICFGELP